MPKCAWLLIATLALLLHHTVGIAETLNVALASIAWAATTPAALVIVAALAAWHLANAHTPNTRRRTPAHA